MSLSLRRITAIVIVTTSIAAALWVGFLAASYTSESVSSGSAHGFKIGESKSNVAASLDVLRREYPEAAVYVSYGGRAGDNFTVSASQEHLNRLKPHDQWDVLLDGPNEFSNLVRLTFKGARLETIYQHRQYFELP